MTVAVTFETRASIITVVTGSSLDAADRDAIFEILDDNMQATFGRHVLLDARGCRSQDAVRSLLRNLAFRGFTKIAVLSDALTENVVNLVSQSMAIDVQLHSSLDFANEWLCNEFSGFA